MTDKPKIGETMPAGWFVDQAHYQIKSGWMMTEFIRAYTRGPHQPLSSQRWKPVWRYRP